MASALRILRPLVYRSCNNFISKFKPLSASASYSACHKALNNFKKAQGSPLLYGHFSRRNEVVQVRCMSLDKKFTQEEICDKVLNVCKMFDRIAETEKVTLEAHFNKDLGLDSLDHVELIMNMEDEFDIEIPDADAEKLLRPKDIVEFIMRKLEADSSKLVT